MDLKNIELFRDFTDEELSRFAGVVQEVSLRPGDLMFKEGDPGDALYVITDGAIRIFKAIQNGGGEEKSLALLEPGTYLGEMTLIDGTPRSASARAETVATVLKITRDSFLALLRSYPQAAIRLFVSFMKVMSQRLRQTNEELVVMYEVGKIIGAAPPLPELLRSLLERTMAGANAGFGVFFKINDITSKLEVVEAVGPGFEQALDLKTGVTDGVAGYAIKNNATVKIDDFEIDPRFLGAPRFGYEKKAMLVTPLAQKNEAVGAILLGDPRDTPAFTSANLNLIQAVAAEAAAAVDAALMHADSDARNKHERHFFRY